MSRWTATVLVLAVVATACASATGDEPATLTIYSGRNEELVGPLIDRFEEETGIATEVRYASTAQQAATILEEGDATPADVFYAQDAGALGALQDAGRLARLPEDLLARVDPRFRSREGVWVGTSGRARTVVYDTRELDRSDLPASVLDLTDPAWRGRIGWAPTNASFQAFVTAMRVTYGDERTRDWLEGMLANGVEEYPSNIPIVDAVGRGEIDVGLVNHYYLYRFLDEDPGFPAENAFLGDDVGGLVNVAGVGVVEGSDQTEAAQRFVAFLLSEDAQAYFAEETFEYPLLDGVAADGRLPALRELDPPDVDLTDLDDLAGTLDLLRDVGALR